MADILSAWRSGGPLRRPEQQTAAAQDLLGTDKEYIPLLPKAEHSNTTWLGCIDGWSRLSGSLVNHDPHAGDGTVLRPHLARKTDFMSSRLVVGLSQVRSRQVAVQYRIPGDEFLDGLAPLRGKDQKGPSVLISPQPSTPHYFSTVASAAGPHKLGSCVTFCM